LNGAGGRRIVRVRIDADQPITRAEGERDFGQTRIQAHDPPRRCAERGADASVVGDRQRKGGRWRLLSRCQRQAGQHQRKRAEYGERGPA
jgi:hypothetical protein